MQRSGVRGSGIGCRVQRSGVGGSGFGCRVQRSGVGGSGFCVRVQKFRRGSCVRKLATLGLVSNSKKIPPSCPCRDWAHVAAVAFALGHRGPPHLNLGFKVWSLGFRVYCFGFRVLGFGLSV